MVEVATKIQPLFPSSHGLMRGGPCSLMGGSEEVWRACSAGLPMRRNKGV
jgi:hypothetical protein